MKDNLLYQNSSAVELMRRKGGCIFAIVDTPRTPETQELHNASRTLEKVVRRGARFTAVDKLENVVLASKLLVDDAKYGSFLYSRGQWVPYKGPNTYEGVRDFMNENKCGLQIATPSPTPEPLPDLPDLPDNDFAPAGDGEDDDDDDDSPARRAQAFRDRADRDDDDEHGQAGDGGGEEDISEWSDDDDI
jgi:hypothetical protein